MRTDEIIAKIRKYGVRKLARETGVSPNTLYGWTQKEKKPSKRILSKIALKFGVEVEE